jgi:hypothetical protein
MEARAAILVTEPATKAGARDIIVAVDRATNDVNIAKLEMEDSEE